MSTIICNYAVLRFQPYPETGEFANLGIVMLCSNGQFLYVAETRTRQRVTQFFDKLEPMIFTKARRQFLGELKRVANLANENSHDRSMQLGIFQHLVAPRETMFKFSLPSTLATKDPEKALDELFKRYVHHDFSQQPDQESKLTSKVTAWLKNFTDRHYSKVALGNDLVQVKFPLVWKESGVARQAIKPITFDLDDSNSIIEKGDKWLMRMKRLRSSGKLPLDTVFVSREPSESSGPRRRAYLEVEKELSAAGELRIIPFSLGESKIKEAIVEIPALH